MSYKVTPQQAKNEFLRCGKDAKYFIKMYCKIAHPIRGLISFQTFDFQDELLESFSQRRFNIVLKARQLGISTLVAGYILWLMMFNRHKSIVVIATKERVAANLVTKVRTMYHNLPEFMKSMNKVDIENRGEFKLKKGSFLKAEATSSNAGRSEALSLLVIDEAAHVEGLDGEDGMWTAIGPTLAEGGACIALSTPNGASGWFFDKYSEAEQGKNDFFPTKLLWDVHPNRDSNWFEKETMSLDERQVAQEYLCDFLSSGATVISTQDLHKIKERIESINPETHKEWSEPLYKTGFDRNYWIWKQPVEGHAYLISADVARGDWKDFSTFHVMDLNTSELVAEYQGKVASDIFAKMLYDVAINEYFSPLLVVESNKGEAVLLKLQDLGYPNLYWAARGDSHKYVSQYEADMGVSAQPGLTISVKTRPMIVAKLEEYIRRNQIIIYSKRLYHELLTFVWKDAKPQAQQGNNDDLVMALGILCYVKDIAIEQNTRELEYDRALLGTIFCSSVEFDSSIEASRGFRVGPELETEMSSYKSNRSLPENHPDIERIKKFDQLSSKYILPIFKG